MSRVGIDLDGVCYDFAASLRQFLSCSNGSCELCDRSYPDPTCWEFYKDWGMTTESFLREARAGVEAGVVFRWGDPHPGTRKALSFLWSADHEVIIVTDRTGLGGPKAETNTREWLKEHNLPYDELHFDADKTAYDCDYFIEDKLENYDALDAAGVKVYLWDRPWNQDDSKERRRVWSWDEFLNAVGACSNCDGRKCMDCVFRVYDHECADSCPYCCGDQAYARAYAYLAERRLTTNEVRVTSSTGGEKGQKQARLGSLDPEALLKVAEVAGFGEQKYSRLNYMKGYDWSLSFDAGMRHRLAFWSGEDFDPESGLPHLAHAAWHDLAQLAFFLKELGTDDRWKEDEGDDDTRQ